MPGGDFRSFPFQIVFSPIIGCVLPILAVIYAIEVPILAENFRAGFDNSSGVRDKIPKIMFKKLAECLFLNCIWKLKKHSAFTEFIGMTEQKNLSDKIGKLFKRYGIRSITMDDVARELGMSKKTLYQIVPDKSKLIETVITDEYNYYRDKLNAIKELNSGAILGFIRLNELLYDFLLHFSPVANHDLEKLEPALYKTIKEGYVKSFLGAILDNLKRGKEEGLYRKELDIEIISKLHLARIEQIPNSKIFHQDEFTSQEFVKEICIYHLHGVLNAKGMELLKQYENEIDNILKTRAI